MVVLLSGNKVHLAGCEEVNATAADRKALEIDHVLAGAIDENTYFIIGMAVRLLRFMRILFILDRLSLYLKYMKCDVFLALGQFIYVNVSQHDDLKIVSSSKTVRDCP